MIEIQASGPLADAIFPVSFLDRSDGSLQPEKRLLLAVLEGAVSDFQKYSTATSGRGRRLFAEAKMWLESSGTDRPFDFESICQAVGLDPACIRAGLQRWRAARRQDPRPLTTSLDFPMHHMARTRHQIAAAG
jgi:hypothetical protein